MKNLIVGRNIPGRRRIFNIPKVINMSNRPLVKILCCYHKPAKILSNNIFVPINGGRSILKTEQKNKTVTDNVYNWLAAHTIGDDTGENISDKNNQYNEMTCIYWAWKNYDRLGDPEFIGLSHYRRHFIFSDYKKQKSYWTVNFARPDDDYVNNLHMERIPEYLNQFDCLYACSTTETQTVYEQYAVSHDATDLQFVLDYISTKYPQYKQSATKYLDGHNNYFCNMFVLKKELFFKYCEFIFDILGEFLKQKDYSESSYEDRRLFISERITGIFIQYLIDTGEKSAPLNISMLDNTDIKEEIKPFSDKNNIPIVFATDANYSDMLSVCLESLLVNSSADNNYDIFILNSGLTDAIKSKLISQCSNRNNVRLTFIDMATYMDDIKTSDLYIELEHVSLATYYRFFVPEIFRNFDKILYLDCDLIVNADIADLYKFDIKDQWIGAALDIRESIPTKLSMQISGCNWRNYVIKTLGLAAPYKYFQAGVLIFNIRQFIENNVMAKCFQKLTEIKNPILSDQDILNSVCYTHVAYFPTCWNMEWQILFEFPDYSKKLRADMYDMYQEALRQPNIIHYASLNKPTNCPQHRFADIWWKYARQTPFYENLLWKLHNANMQKAKGIESIKSKIKKYDFLYSATFGLIQKFKKRKNSYEQQLQQVQTN